MAQPARKGVGGNAFAAAINSAAKPAETVAKKKSTAPVVDPPDDIKAAVDEHVKAKAQEKEAKAVKDSTGETILAFVNNVQDTDGFDGKFRNSYAVRGHQTTIKFVSQNRASINAADEEQIKELLGQDFDSLIERRMTVKLKDEVLEDEALQQALMDAIGDQFAVYFEVETKLAVKEGFDQNVYRVISKENLPVLRTFVRPYKPALR